MEEIDLEAIILEEFGDDDEKEKGEEPPRIPREGGQAEEDELAKLAQLVEEVNELTDVIRADLINQLGPDVVNFQTGEIEMTAEMMEYIEQYLDDYYKYLENLSRDYQKLTKADREKFKKQFSNKPLKELSWEEIGEARAYVKKLRDDQRAAVKEQAKKRREQSQLATKLRKKQPLSQKEYERLGELAEQTQKATDQAIKELETELRKLAGRVTEKEYPEETKMAGEEYREPLVLPPLSSSGSEELSSDTVSFVSDEEEVRPPRLFSRPITDDESALNFCSRYATGNITDRESLDFIKYVSQRRIISEKDLKTATIGELCILLRKRIAQPPPSPKRPKRQPEKKKQPAPPSKRPAAVEKKAEERRPAPPKKPKAGAPPPRILSDEEIEERKNYATKLKQIKLAQLKKAKQISQYPAFEQKIKALLAAELDNPTSANYKMEWMKKI